MRADTGDDDRLLTARVEDALRAAASGRGPRFVGFLDMRGQKLALNAAQSCAAQDEYGFWGGFEGAERKMLGAGGDAGAPEREQYPIAAVRFSWKFASLTHRDFLGALMSLGMKMDRLGDIVVGGSECTVILDASMADFVENNLTRVGSAGVSAQRAEPSEVSRVSSFENIGDTVASARLDCVLGALVGASRTQSVKMIRQGLVMVDFEQTLDPDRRVDDGATVSVRGSGRYIVDRVGPQTKKGRMRLSARKYL
jgi:RNA-binding protein YlmH